MSLTGIIKTIYVGSVRYIWHLEVRLGRAQDYFYSTVSLWRHTKVQNYAYNIIDVNEVQRNRKVFEYTTGIILRSNKSRFYKTKLCVCVCVCFTFVFSPATFFYESFRQFSLTTRTIHLLILWWKWYTWV